MINELGNLTGDTQFIGNRFEVGGNLNVSTHPQVGPSFFLSEDASYESSKKAIASRAENTCNWVLEHKTFLKWNSAQGGDVLWLTANPGCGKSVFSKALIEQGLVSTSTEDLICYFFFKDDQYRRTSSSALCAILHQIFSKRSQELFKKYASDAIRVFGNALKRHPSALWSILMKVSQDVSIGQVVCILDALDECQVTDRNDLIAEVSDFYNNLSKKGRDEFPIKFLLTSRPYTEIEDEFLEYIENLSDIRIAGENKIIEISSEIDRVILSEVKKYKAKWDLNSLETSHLQKRLSATKQRTYLWLYLVIKELHKSLGHSKRRIDEVIDSLPQTVDQAYEKILRRCKKKEARRLLQIIVAAYRPLTVSEIDVALEIRPGFTSFSDLSCEGVNRRVRWIRSSCGLFVNVVDNRVLLIHETAKNFLIRSSSDIWDGQSWKNSIDLGVAHSALGKFCITLLMFHNFRVTNTDHWESSKGRYAAFTEIAASYPFFDYASFFWHDHVADAPPMEQEWIDKATRLCEFRFETAVAWFGSLLGISIALVEPDALMEESKRWVDWSSLSSTDLLRLPPLYWVLATGMRKIARPMASCASVLKTPDYFPICGSHSLRSEAGETIAFLLSGSRFHKWLHSITSSTTRRLAQSWKTGEIMAVFLEREGHTARISQGIACSSTDDDAWPDMCSKNWQRLPLLVHLSKERMQIHESTVNLPNIPYSEMKVVLLLHKRPNGDIHVIEGVVEVAIGDQKTAAIKTFTLSDSPRADLDFANLFSMASPRYTIVDRPIQNDDFFKLWCCLEAIRISAKNESLDPFQVKLFDGYVYWRVCRINERKARIVLESLHLPEFYWADGNQARFRVIRWISVCLLISGSEEDLLGSDSVL